MKTELLKALLSFGYEVSVSAGKEDNVKVKVALRVAYEEESEEFNIQEYGEDKLNETINIVAARLTEKRKKNPEWYEHETHVIKLLNTHVKELELSVRAANALVNNNVKTVRDIVSLEKRDLLRFPNLGRKSFKEIKNMLTNLGLCLGMDLSKYEMVEKLFAENRVWVNK